MSQIDNTTGGVGVVEVAGLQITISPLSQKEERALLSKIRKGARDRRNATSFADRPAVKSLLDALRTMPTAYMESVRELTRMAANAEAEPITDNQTFTFRTSPAGVAIELYDRGRKMTPGLDQAALTALITEVNAEEVFEEMFAVVEGTGPGK